MKFQDREYCDGCGDQVYEADCSYSRCYVLQGIEGEDRCLGGSGVDILEIENALYQKHRESHDSFYEAERALADTRFFFCDGCCSSWKDPAIMFENKVRAQRAELLMELLSSSQEKPAPRVMTLPEQKVEFEHGKVSCRVCLFLDRWNDKCCLTKQDIDDLDHQLSTCPLKA